MTGPATRRDVASERETPRATFERRLRLLGATEDEISATLEALDDVADDADLAENVARIMNANDVELRAAIEESRGDYEEQTLTPEEQAELDAERATAEAWTKILADSYDHVHQPEPGVIEWVQQHADPPLAARAILTWEQDVDTPRAELVDELEQIAVIDGGDPAPEIETGGVENAPVVGEGGISDGAAD